MARLAGWTPKWRRVDEDLKRASIFEMVMDSRADNGRDALRLVGVAKVATAATWDERELLCYQAACWQACSSLRAISVSLDGKRVGQPAEETDVFAA